MGGLPYHGISDNKRRVKSFIDLCKRSLLSWFNRRGGRKPMTWKKLIDILNAIDFPKQWKTIPMF